MKKIFEEPKLVINDLTVEDVITASINPIMDDEELPDYVIVTN